MSLRVLKRFVSNNAYKTNLFNPKPISVVPPAPGSQDVPHVQDLVGQKAGADLPLEPSHEKWTRQVTGQEERKETIPECGTLLEHEMYTPMDRPNLDVGPLVKPLHWPEYDQTMLSRQHSNLPAGLSWEYQELEDREFSALDGYPKIPLQYAILKDPFKYWDQQARRNYGELIYDHQSVAGIWGPGPLNDWKQPAASTVSFFAFITGLWAMFYYAGLEEQKWISAKPYPFDGLRVELGGNPKDKADDWMAANK